MFPRSNQINTHKMVFNLTFNQIFDITDGSHHHLNIQVICYSNSQVSLRFPSYCIWVDLSTYQLKPGCVLLIFGGNTPKVAYTIMSRQNIQKVFGNQNDLFSHCWLNIHRWNVLHLQQICTYTISLYQPEATVFILCVSVGGSTDMYWLKQ